MLMVIFGAGASYDSVPSRPPKEWPPERLPDRPPLANQLFDDRPLFTGAMSRFPKCQPIIPYLQRRQDTLVERVLEELQAEAEHYPERHQQLAAIRYYLHFMLWECKRHWNDVAKGVTNYKTLLDQLERWRKAQEQLCLVTFNYDTMLEDALPTVGVEIRKLSDYIGSQTYKVIKLHGSVNWAREVETPIENLGNKSTWQVANELIDRAPDLSISQRYCMVTEHPIGKLDHSVLFPALAIPLERKPDYECPPDHLEALSEFIPQVAKILIVGWRGTENRFLQLLAKHLKRAVRVLTVAKDQQEANEANKRLEAAGIKGEFMTTQAGFTDLVVNRRADFFLGDSK